MSKSGRRLNGSQPGLPDKADAGACEDLSAVLERPLLCYAMSLTSSERSALELLREVSIQALGGKRKLRDPGQGSIVA